MMPYVPLMIRGGRAIDQRRALFVAAPSLASGGKSRKFPERTRVEMRVSIDLKAVGASAAGWTSSPRARGRLVPAAIGGRGGKGTFTFSAVGARRSRESPKGRAAAAADHKSPLTTFSISYARFLVTETRTKSYGKNYSAISKSRCPFRSLRTRDPSVRWCRKSISFSRVYFFGRQKARP
jgi:hypothetical protein